MVTVASIEDTALGVAGALLQSLVQAGATRHALSASVATLFRLLLGKEAEVAGCEEEVRDRLACIKPVLESLLIGEKASGGQRAKRNLADHDAELIGISKFSDKQAKVSQRGGAARRNRGGADIGVDVFDLMRGMAAEDETQSGGLLLTGIGDQDKAEGESLLNTRLMKLDATKSLVSYARVVVEIYEGVLGANFLFSLPPVEDIFGLGVKSKQRKEINEALNVTIRIYYERLLKLKGLGIEKQFADVTSNMFTIVDRARTELARRQFADAD